MSENKTLKDKVTVSYNGKLCINHIDNYFKSGKINFPTHEILVGKTWIKGYFKKQYDIATFIVIGGKKTKRKFNIYLHNVKRKLS